MNDAEMLTVLRTLASFWPQTEIEARVSAGYSTLCGDLDAGDVIATLRDLALDGREFAPPAGVVAKAVIRKAERAALAEYVAARDAERAAALIEPDEYRVTSGYSPPPHERKDLE